MQIDEKLKEFGSLKTDVSLKEYNTFKVDSVVKYLVDVNSESDLINLVSFLKENDIKFMILGNGSNVIFASKYYSGVIIKLNNLNDILINGEIVTVGAGVMMPKLVNECVNNSLKGLEWASGIPGTVGGCVYGNAGAYLSEIMDFLVSVKVIENGEIKVIKKDDIKYSYRYTSFKDNKDIIILSAVLKLEMGDKNESLNLIKSRLERRIASQPLEYPSAGSVFRNPEGDFAGRLIEECNLKGFNINGAYVSDKHANFIINKDNASGEDIKNLLLHIKRTVKDKTDIDLINEQEIIEWS